ncbi:hypothetical protein ABIF90_007790 [Bradyrhizobium japonicum]
MYDQICGGQPSHKRRFAVMFVPKSRCRITLETADAPF